MKNNSVINTVIAQFAIVLLPLVALLAYLVIQGERHAAALELQHQHYQQMLVAWDRYTQFADGTSHIAEGAVLSGNALASLAGAHHNLTLLARQAQSAALAETAKRVGAMSQQLAGDASHKAVLALRGDITALQGVFNNTKTTFEQGVNGAIQRAAEQSHRELHLAIAMSVMVLLMTIWFVWRTTRRLSRPLRLAVSIADRIADNREVAPHEFALKYDIGNLLSSLRRMYGSLTTYRVDAVAYEEKIRQLAQSQSNLADAQQLAKMGNWHWDTREPHAQWSDEMYRLMGLAPGACEPLSENYIALVDQDEREDFRSHFKHLMREPGATLVEHRITTHDGLYRDILAQISSRANADGKVTYMHGTVQDITDRKLAERKMHHLAMYDALTGLPNRQLFGEQLGRAVARAQREKQIFAVMFIDLDRFKRINDTLGHATGDALLREVAARLNRCVRSADYVGRDGDDDVHDEPKGRVARLAGDEFIVTLENLVKPQNAARVARRIIEAVAHPFMLDGQEVVVTTSVGIALYPSDGNSAELLLKSADAAMYQAKNLGRNAYQFFAGEMNSVAVERLRLESELRRAAERNQLSLHYQIKVNARTGAIAGVEALMRWRHPELGAVSPGTFIPLAEDLGLIVGFGEWVLDAACRQIKAWRNAGLPPVPVAINLASPSFQQPNLPQQVAAVLRRHGVSPEELCIEATESILMRDANTTLSALKALRVLGVKLSIDDFGTGYSSLSYLRRFPIDQLKIDRSFVKDLATNSDDAAIIAAIASLARSLGLDTVAEGVETIEQARLLLEQGCHIMQGYFFSEPLPAEHLTVLLEQGPAFNRRMLALLGRTTEGTDQDSG